MIPSVCGQSFSPLFYLYIFVHRNIKHRDKLNKQFKAWMLPLVFNRLQMSGVVINNAGKVISFANRAFLIACPIGLKSKSKLLFLSSISSPPILWKSYPYILQRYNFLRNDVKSLNIGDLISCYKIFKLIVVYHVVK